MRTALLLVIFLSAHFSHAIVRAVVRKDAVLVYEKPDQRSRPLSKLRKNVKLPASSKSKNGFRKVKTPKGKIGWILEEDLQFSELKPKKEKNDLAKRYFFQPHLQYTFFDNEDLNEALGADALKNGFFYGFTLGRKFSDGWQARFRLERFSSSKSIENSVETANSYDIEAQTMPIMFGVSKDLIEKKENLFSVYTFLGLAFSTEVKATAPNRASPNVTIYSGTPFTWMLGAEYFYQWTDRFSVGAELGYRLLSLSKQSPEQEGTGWSSLFSSSDSQIENSFSGIMFGLTARISF